MSAGRADMPTLLPHQHALVAAFSGDPDLRTIIARWSPGLGAYNAGSAVVQDFVRSHPHSRALVLTPKILQEQACHRLLSLGIDAVAVDRFFYRELEDASGPSKALWPEGKVFVLGREFAQQTDITEALAAVSWGLLVAFDSRLRNDSGHVVQRLLDTSPSMRLLAFTSEATHSDQVVGHAPRIELSVSLRDVVGYDGVTQWLRPTLETIAVQAEPAEQKVDELVRAIAAALRLAGPTWQPAAMRLVSRLQSSPAALEVGLRRVRNRLLHETAQLNEDDFSDEDFEIENRSDAPDENSQKLATMADECLEELNRLAMDSKSAKLLELVLRLRSTRDSVLLVCVFCEHRATALYLKVALEETGSPVHVLHGGMDWSERDRIGRVIRDEGGVLVSTQVLASDALDLPRCGDLIFYDLPSKNDVLDRVFMRFQRIGRQAPLNIYLFTPLVEGDSAHIAAGIARLETLISGER